MVDVHPVALGARYRALHTGGRRAAHDLGAGERFDVALAFEQRNLLDVAEVIIGAAEFRTESRGSHVRADYPERDDAQWLTNVFATREGETLSLRKQWVNESWSSQDGDIRIRPWG